MNSHQQNKLDSTSIEKVFLDQLSILHCAKTHLIAQLPEMIENAAFQVLKMALEEDLEDTKNQFTSLKTIFGQLKEVPETDSCLAINKIMDEARGLVVQNRGRYFENDMSILFYMSAIENLQLGAARILNEITKHPTHKAYAQLISESLDINRDNARLFVHIANEYLQVG